MANVTLLQVGFKALQDKAFFEALMKNPEEALASVGWTLSAEDLATLKKSLSSPPSRVLFDLPKFLRTIHQRGIGDGDWTKFCSDWTNPSPKGK